MSQTPFPGLLVVSPSLLDPFRQFVNTFTPHEEKKISPQFFLQPLFSFLPLQPDFSEELSDLIGLIPPPATPASMSLSRTPLQSVRRMASAKIPMTFALLNQMYTFSLQLLCVLGSVLNLESGVIWTSLGPDAEGQTT